MDSRLFQADCHMTDDDGKNARGNSCHAAIFVGSSHALRPGANGAAFLPEVYPRGGSLRPKGHPSRLLKSYPSSPPGGADPRRLPCPCKVDAVQLLIVSWLLLLTGGILAPALGRRPLAATLVGSGSAALGSLAGLAIAVGALANGQTTGLALATTIPGLTLSLRLDPLAAFFLLPVHLLGLLGAIYGGGYLRGREGRLPGLHWLFYNLLVASMSVVITAANALLFLFAWEGMSLASFFLVITEHQEPANARAGLIYLLATHLGAALLLGGFLTIGAFAGGFDFSAFAALSHLPGPTASLLFILLLLGFGSKAGLFPFHVWLPEAHPAAPSHVSALMSGAMVKTALYGLVRFLLFLPSAPGWWGGTLMALGLAGALFGIAMSAFQSDVKRGLAYSTVENVGLILLALGLWLFCRGRYPQLAALALIGALTHILNHALFKGLLFLGAGSLLHGAGSRNLNRLGGLMRRMPATGLCLVIGALAVTALPPANGLLGEWFIYRGFLEAGVRLKGLAAFFPLVIVGLLALVGGLALLVFSRLIGIALGGEPRGSQADLAHESGALMLVPMFVLAGLCLAGGLAPSLLLGPVLRVAKMIEPPAAPLLAQAGLLPLWLGGLAQGLALLLVLTALLGRWRKPRAVTPAVPTWGCGYLFPTRRMAYSAEGFSELAGVSFFCDCLRPRIEGGRSMRLFPGREVFRHQAPDLVLEAGFLPLFAWVAARCTRLRRLQSGLVHIYVFYIFSVIVALLGWVAIRL